MALRMAEGEKPAFVTTTSELPALPSGVLPVRDVLLGTVTLIRAAPPIVTLVLLPKLEPVIVTAVPPLLVPEFGVMDVITGAPTAGGAGTLYVNAEGNVLDRPSGLLTVTETTPGEFAGLVAVMLVLLTELTSAGSDPNFTVAPG